MLDKINSITSFLSQKMPYAPEMGIILGTGLGGLVQKIDIDFTISYEDIPNFPVSTVEGHHGRLIFGKLSQKKVVAMQGRFHFYEGYSTSYITWSYIWWLVCFCNFI